MEDSKYIMFNIPLVQKYLNCGYPHAAKIFDFLIEENNLKTKIKDNLKYYLLPKEQEKFLYNAIFLYHKKLTGEEYYENKKLNNKQYNFFDQKLIKWNIFKSNNFKKLLNSDIYKQNQNPYLFATLKNHRNIYFYDLNKNGNLFICSKNKLYYNKFIQSLICSIVSKYSNVDIQFMLLTKEENTMLYCFEHLKHIQNKISNKKLENFLYLKSIEHLQKKREEDFIDKDVNSIEENNNSRFVKNYSNKKMSYVILIIEDIERFLESDDKNLKESVLNILNYNKKYGIYSIVSSNRIDDSMKNLCNSILYLDKSKNSFELYNNKSNTSIKLKPFFVSKKDIKVLTKYIQENN